MKIRIINFIFGCALMKAEGAFCERIINIARENGIFIWGLRRIDNRTLTFFVSLKAAKHLTILQLPPHLEIEIEREEGLPAILSRYKRRKMLLICPTLAAIALFCSTFFIWNVNVVTDDPVQEEMILSELKKLGLKRGALKMDIDQKMLQKEMLLSNDSLLWLWVDIKGSSAIVRLAERTAPPEVYDEDEFYNIYSARDGVITSIIVENGIAKADTGDTVLKGQLLIEGAARISDTENVPVHAAGSVRASVWEEKVVSIPKEEEIRTATGAKKEHLSINFLNFSIKLFINSSIEYQKYDIIEKRRDVPLLPLAFCKTTYEEVNVSYSENDINAMIEKAMSDFENELMQDGAFITYTEHFEDYSDECVNVTLRALCEEEIAIERRMNFGEDTWGTQP